jgi:hypothetical protein
MKSISTLSHLVETDIDGKGKANFGYWWKKEKSIFGGNVLRPNNHNLNLNLIKI